MVYGTRLIPFNAGQAYLRKKLSSDPLGSIKLTFVSLATKVGGGHSLAG